MPRVSSVSRRGACGALLLAAAGSLGFAAAPALERFEAVEPHMGTLVRITVYAPDEAAARRAFAAGFDRIRALDAILSDYKADSELSRITREAVQRPVRVSADLFTVLAASQRIARETGGAFDITQGPVIRLWREARRSGRLPDPAALEEASARTGYTRMHLDKRRRTVRFDVPGMVLDVGAIGKGYAASEAVEALRRTGARRTLVAISGDIACGDAPPDQRGWRVRVHDGSIGPTAVPPVLWLTHAAVSTSGNTEQHLDVDGTRYSHVVDPASRTGLTDDVMVTVVARHGLEADGLDTAASLIGPARGLALLKARGVAGLIVVRKDGDVRVYHTDSRVFRDSVR